MPKDDELTRRAKAEAAYYEEDWEQMTQARRNIYLHNAGCPVDQLPKVSTEEAPELTIPCPACEGKKFQELDGGLLQVTCAICGGTGIRPSDYILPEEIEEVLQEEKSAPKVIPTPKAGQYFCIKCGICHYENKKVGRRHLKYK